MKTQEETVQCPHHNKPLKITTTDGKEIAVCDCDPNDTRWYGKPVYTKLVEVKPAGPIKETEK